MSVSLLVPVSDNTERQHLWRWIERRYRSELPDWEIRVGTSPEPWSKGYAVASAAKRASGDVLVIADADCWVPAGALEAAVGCVEAGDPWAMPHGRVYRINAKKTRLVLTGEDPSHFANRATPWNHDAVVGGGVTVLSRFAYEKVNGIDARFVGWGGDDEAFGHALDTLVGEHVCLGAPLVHLYHEPRPERRLSNNPTVERLAGRYRDAYHNPNAMRVLVQESRRSQTPDVEFTGAGW